MLQLQLHINQPDAWGCTPLMWAAARCGDASVAARLLQLGAHILPNDNRGMNASMHAIQNMNLDCLQLILAEARRRGPSVIQQLSTSDPVSDAAIRAVEPVTGDGHAAVCADEPCSALRLDAYTSMLHFAKVCAHAWVPLKASACPVYY